MIVDVAIGTGTGLAGDEVEISVQMESHGILARGFQFHLAFDGLALPGAVGAFLPAAPADWILQANLAGPGDLRFLGLDLSGRGAALSGSILKARFTTTRPGKVPITASLASFSDTAGDIIPTNISDGELTILGRIMAKLTDGDRTLLWAKTMSDLSITRESLTLAKGDLRAALNAVDDWVDDNQLSFNQALPQPARSALTASQKARLLTLIVRRRFEVA